MDDDFNPESLRPTEYRPDAEFTLGPMVITGLVAVLLLLCGLCFWVGYSMGGRGTRASQPVVQSATQSSTQSTGSVAKPSASPLTVSHSQSVSQSDTTFTSPADAAQSSSPATLPAPANALMVHIASVSHQEDADVLVDALRKRGYAVAVRRDPTDDMFHVQVGPFSSLNDANATRQKLLNDGYNASVEP
jgi:cell division septation protein DedD